MPAGGRSDSRKRLSVRAERLHSGGFQPDRFRASNRQSDCSLIYRPPAAMRASHRRSAVGSPSVSSWRGWRPKSAGNSVRLPSSDCQTAWLPNLSHSRLAIVPLERARIQRTLEDDARSSRLHAEDGNLIPRARYGDVQLIVSREGKICLALEVLAVGRWRHPPVVHADENHAIEL